MSQIASIERPDALATVLDSMAEAVEQAGGRAALGDVESAWAWLSDVRRLSTAGLQMCEDRMERPTR